MRPEETALPNTRIQSAAPPPAEGALPAKGSLGALAFAHFVNDGYINYLPAILPVLLQQLSIPLALVGTLVLAIQGIGSLLQPVLGWWADRTGGRRFTLVGLALSAIGASLIGLAPSYWLLLVLLAIAGLGNSMFHPQTSAAARSLSGSRHGLRMSFFLIGGELGRGIWPSLASLLVLGVGLHGLWLLALPGLAIVLLLSRVTPSQAPQPVGSLRAALSDGGWRAGALVAFVGLRASTTYGVSTFVPLFWRARGGSLLGGASLISVMLLVGILGNLSGGFVVDRVGRRPVLLASSVLSAAFLTLFMVVDGYWLWVALALLGIATFATAPVTMLIGQDLFHRSRSLGSGVALGLGNLVGTVVVLVLGFVAASHGLEAPLWWIAGVSLLGVPFALLLTNGEIGEQAAGSRA